MTVAEHSAMQDKRDVEIVHRWWFPVTPIQSVIRPKTGPYENEHRHIVLFFFLERPPVTEGRTQQHTYINHMM